MKITQQYKTIVDTVHYSGRCMNMGQQSPTAAGAKPCTGTVKDQEAELKIAEHASTESTLHNLLPAITVEIMVLVPKLALTKIADH